MNVTRASVSLENRIAEFAAGSTLSEGQDEHDQRGAARPGDTADAGRGPMRGEQGETGLREQVDRQDGERDTDQAERTLASLCA